MKNIDGGNKKIMFSIENINYGKKEQTFPVQKANNEFTNFRFVSPG